LKGGVDAAPAKGHFIEVLLLLAQLFTLMVFPFPGAESLDDLPFTAAEKNGLEGGLGRGAGVGNPAASLPAMFLEHQPIAVLPGQPGGRTPAGQLGLNLELVSLQRPDAGLEAILGRLSLLESARVDLQRLLLTPLAKIS
jgi:hypothetical protein